MIRRRWLSNARRGWLCREESRARGADRQLPHHLRGSFLDSDRSRSVHTTAATNCVSGDKKFRTAPQTCQGVGGRGGQIRPPHILGGTSCSVAVGQIGWLALPGSPNDRSMSRPSGGCIMPVMGGADSRIRG